MSGGYVKLYVDHVGQADTGADFDFLVGCRGQRDRARVALRIAMHQFDLTGRRAVVTGGAQGIGRAIAERLLRSGARVSLWDCDAAMLETAAGELASLGEVHTATVDVVERRQVDAATAATAERFGGIDILVANAGITGPNVPTWEYPPEEWRRVLDIDLTGVFLCCRAVVPAHARSSSYGRIVNIASIAGKEGNPNASAYSAAKAGVIALTKSLGKELAGEDIAVNCITPAAAKTRIFEQMTQTHIDYMLSKIPRARFVLVEEIAALAAWLVSEENSFATGAVYDMSGGRDVRITMNCDQRRLLRRRRVTRRHRAVAGRGIPPRSSSTRSAPGVTEHRRRRAARAEPAR